MIMLQFRYSTAVHNYIQIDRSFGKFKANNLRIRNYEMGKYLLFECNFYVQWT